MNLNSLSRVVTKSKKRLGLGIGSGKGGHTSSRGQKGQKSRGKIHPLFEGTKTKKSLLQRLPLLRGKGKLRSLNKKTLVVNLGDLEKLPTGSKVDVQLLIQHGLVANKASKLGCKVLAGGELTHKLTVILPASKEAIKKIEKAGGAVEQPGTVENK